MSRSDGLAGHHASVAICLRITHRRFGAAVNGIFKYRGFPNIYHEARIGHSGLIGAGNDSDSRLIRL